MSLKSMLLALFFLPSASLALLGQTAASNQAEIEQHQRLARQYLQEQRPDLAIPELQTLVALDPQNTDTQANLGVLLFFRGDYQGAVPHLRTAISTRPELWKIQGLLGLAEGRSGDSESSRKDLEAVFPHLTEDKFKTEVGRALIDNYTSTGDLEKAATVASTLLASQPTDTSLLYISYRLYNDLADKAMLTLALAAPNSAQMHQVMARELARHGDEAPAIANYREAIKIDPKLPGVHFELGNLLYNSTDEKLQAEAETEFKAALAANPNDEKSQLMLGMIAAKHGDSKAAYDDYSRALQLQPDDADAALELAKVLVTMNQSEKAQELLERAIQIDPSNSVAHYRLATLYRRQGKTEEADKEIAEYKKYKEMKDKLQKVFHDMRVESGQKNSDDADLPK
ncbi:tetratricopeptide repeat protein [Alloacidobacterium dinghuense]|uniref:Tetratricopeptide repeat protein n=1 Tax=Alloacidobacterium dinghuense TaxID=2763107 RepID=A0A7G8BEF5_9BACT|nr:tetratricopeptide repeat protein [Alloacidobacterium dinghuense]QNI30925.1 tetratricopeptide repeat protein [Alloacidobacterium dinghuense]